MGVITTLEDDMANITKKDVKTALYAGIRALSKEKDQPVNERAMDISVLSQLYIAVDIEDIKDVYEGVIVDSL